MSKTIQNFYKTLISLDWSIGLGIFYVTLKPTITDGWLVISPNNPTLREIVRYTSTGSDANGDYIVITERGVGGTTEQIHSVGEPIRMNITAEYWNEMSTDITNIVAAGVPNANTTTMGGVEIATDAEFIAGTNVGSTGASLVATPGQILPNTGKRLDLQVYTTLGEYRGDTGTRFDISKPTGTTYRYTWDGTGTNPTITALTFPIGANVFIDSQAMSVGNRGPFTITGSGTNYFEVSNAFGVVEVDKTLSSGYLYLYATPLTWTKPADAKVVEIICIGGGGGGSGGTSTTTSAARYFTGNGGGGGAAVIVGKYEASAVGNTEIITVGAGGAGGIGGKCAGVQNTTDNNRVSTNGSNGGLSAFGSFIRAGGGGGGEKYSSCKGGGGGGSISSGYYGASGSPSAVDLAYGISTQGVFRSTNTGDGSCSEYGGASGGFGAGSTSGNQRNGGSSIYAGAGGGGAGGAQNIASDNTYVVAVNGASGGTCGSYGPSGGGAGASYRVNGTDGLDNSVLKKGFCGSGGGAGGYGLGDNLLAGNGGKGGFPGSGGGSGGGCGYYGAPTLITAGDGGAGGNGKVIVITYF